SDVDWSRRRREVRLAEIDRHVLKVRVSVGRAIEPCVGEMRRITAVLASQYGGISRPGDEGENECEGLGLPAHRLTPLFRPAFISSPFKSSYRADVARAIRPRKGCWLAARRARKLFGAAVMPVSMIGRQLKAEHPGNDQAKTGHAPHARRFAERQHADGH